MKKGLLSFLALAGVLVGCQNYDDQFDALNSEIESLQTQLGGLTDIENDIATLTTDLAELSQRVQDLQTGTSNNATSIGQLLSDLTALQTAVDNIDVQAQVEAATADIDAEVLNLEEEIDDIWAAIQDLLDRAAIIEQDVRITNLAELDYAETLFTFESDTDVVSSVIVKGNVIIDVQGASDELNTTANLARINAITGMIGTIIQGLSGSDIMLTNASSTTISFGNLTYIDGNVSLQGNSSIDAVTTINGDLSFDAIEAAISFPALTSVEDVIILSDVGITSIDLSNISDVEGSLFVASATPTSSLILANATSVNIGGLGIPTVVDLAQGSFTSTSDETGYSGTISATSITIASADISSSTLTSTGAIEVGSVSGGGSNTTITGDGITIVGNAVANVLTLNGGDISTGVVSVSAASTFTGSNTTIGGTNGSALLIINATGDADVTVNGTINSDLTIADAADVTFGATAVASTTQVIYSGTFAAASLATISGAFTLIDTGAGHALDLPALTTVSGAFTADDVTTFTANELTSNTASISTDSATTFTAIKLVVGAAISLEDATVVDFGTATSTYLTAADTDDFTTMRLHALDNAYNFGSNHAAIETVVIIGKANANLTAQDNPVTFNGNANLESLTVQGYISDLTVNNTTLESLVTTTDARITSLTVSNNGSLATLTTGHQHIEPGDASDIIVTSNTSTRLTSLDFSTVTKVKNVTVTGNSSVTLITAPSATGLLAEPLAPINVTVSGAGLASTYTAAESPTQTTPYVPATFSTSSISGFRAFIEAYTSQTASGGGARSGTVSYSFDLNTTGMAGDTDAVNGPDNSAAGTDGQHDGDALIDNDVMNELPLLATTN